MATLMSDEVFHEVAYKAKNRSHILAGVDEFLDAVTVLPPGEWDPAIRLVDHLIDKSTLFIFNAQRSKYH